MTKVDPIGLDLNEETVVKFNRVAKVVSGGRRFRFSALVAIGDGNGNVGLGHGKANEVLTAIAKSKENAKKNLFRVPIIKGTIPHKIIGKFGAAKVMLKPASPGTGIIAGGAMRAVLELAGVKDVLAKSYGSTNPINVVRATFKGLASIESPEKVALRRS